ncbi:MAG: hypothetical protein LJE64_13045 [Desulfofustis sp.]|nr:hypothetical protein [Desulfofustis sp.]
MVKLHNFLGPIGVADDAGDRFTGPESRQIEQIEARLPGLDEWKHGQLPQHILQNETIWSYLQVTAANGQFLLIRIRQAAEESLVGQAQPPLQSLAHNPK